MFPAYTKARNGVIGIVILVAVLVCGGAAVVYSVEGTAEQPAPSQGYAVPAPGAGERVPVKILAINDFHGQLGAGEKGARPGGGERPGAGGVSESGAPGLGRQLPDRARGRPGRGVAAQFRHAAG